MKQRPAGRPSSSETVIRDIKRQTRKQYSAEEKIRIVLDGLRGEDSMAERCRREGIAHTIALTERMRCKTKHRCRSACGTVSQTPFENG
jgi:transposase-like protein